MDLLTLVAVSSISLTAYQSVPEQTDESPFITSIGHQTSEAGVAVSRELLWSGEVCYGDIVYIPGEGSRVVNDVMAQRHVRSMDVWVPNIEAERQFHRRNVFPNGSKSRKRTVYVVRVPERECLRGDAMAMVNAKKMRNLIRTLQQILGREPSLKELLRAQNGQLPKKEK